eukprot:1873468-Amphidinium_carterae.2
MAPMQCATYSWVSNTMWSAQWLVEDFIRFSQIERVVQFYFPNFKLQDVGQSICTSIKSQHINTDVSYHSATVRTTWPMPSAMCNDTITARFVLGFSRQPCVVAHMRPELLMSHEQ